MLINVSGERVAVDVNRPFSTCDGMPEDALNCWCGQSCMLEESY